MKIIDFIYQGQNVQFSDNGNLMVNATQMANIFGVKVHEYFENKSTENFIQACLNDKELNLISKEDLISSKRKTGTWIHKVLALHFAMWLDADFAVWVIKTTDKILTEHYKHYDKHKEAALRKLEAKKEMEALEAELMKDERFEKYLQIKKEMAIEGKIMNKAIKESLYDLFNNPYVEVEN